MSALRGDPGVAAGSAAGRRRVAVGQRLEESADDRRVELRPRAAPQLGGRVGVG